jgi:predicted peptidase
MTARALGTVQGATHGYWEYVPPHYGSGALFPLLIFLHGSGERGSGSLADLQAILGYGIPKLIHASSWPENRTFVVLSPQHTGDGCMSEADVPSFLGFAIGHYDIDPRSVYVTGLSCGGIATWDYIGAHLGEKVAAVVPICGDGRPAFQKAGCALGQVPIWAFHGGADPVVSPAGSTEPIASLMACTSPAPIDARITVYPGVDHDSWSRTYDLSAGNDIYAWLLSHRKP